MQHDVLALAVAVHGNARQLSQPVGHGLQGRLGEEIGGVQPQMPPDEVLGKILLLPAVEAGIECGLKLPPGLQPVEGNQRAECLFVGGAALSPRRFLQAEDIGCAQILHQACAAAVGQGLLGQNLRHAYPGGGQTMGGGEEGIVVCTGARPVYAQHAGSPHDAAATGSRAYALQVTRLHRGA